jgi:hypothetical protein
MQTVAETPEFLAQCKASGVSDAQRKEIVDYLATNPKAGDVMPGTGGARKLRVAGRGKGKSGGYRVITFFAGGDIPVFLLTLFGKGDRADLSQKEKNELRDVLKEIAREYRMSQKRRHKNV